MPTDDSERVGAEGVPPDVAGLTARMARHDEAAWREFYGRYFNRLLGYLLVLTGGREEAARDALQLTLVRVVRNARRFESEAAFWSWLTVLARSSVVDETRKRNRYLALLERFFHRAQTDAGAGGADADKRLAAALDAGLAGLASEDRELVERKYFDAGSVRQIAREVGLTEKAVESRLVRVRRQLKEAVMHALQNE